MAETNDGSDRPKFKPGDKVQAFYRAKWQDGEIIEAGWKNASVKIAEYERPCHVPLMLVRVGGEPEKAFVFKPTKPVAEAPQRLLPLRTPGWALVQDPVNKSFMLAFDDCIITSFRDKHEKLAQAVLQFCKQEFAAGSPSREEIKA